MANPLRDFFLGQITTKKELVEAHTPRRTFADVILPDSTRKALDHALLQIKKHDLIFQTWGLGERHASGLGVALNFAGPPGTGKTACAEAIANALGKKLLVVRYSEMESLWAGETGKNVAAVFASAHEQDAVLFFDEADAIAGRRFTSVTQGYQREANTVVNVLLKELEEFDGVVIFATNLAANFDPAFERRVRTHILFEMPGPKEREQIWKVQLHARKTPLAPDVDFKILAEKHALSGGDIKNAVLKAAQIATGEPGLDAAKQIHQRHFDMGVADVMSAKKVMEQSIFADGDGSHPSSALAGLNGAWSQMSRDQESLEGQLLQLSERVGEGERHIAALPGIVERFDDASRMAMNTLRANLEEQISAAKAAVENAQRGAEAAQGEAETARREAVAGREAVAQVTAQLGAELPSLREAAAKLETGVKDVRAALEQHGVKLDEHHARLDDLWARHEAEKASAATVHQDFEARLERAKRAIFCIAVSAAFVSIVSLIVAAAT